MTVSLKPVSHGSGAAMSPSSWIGWTTSPGVDEALAVHHLERDLVDVDRVGVGGDVVDLPDLGLPTAGFSVTGSIHLRSVHAPSATVPRSRPRPDRSTCARPSRRCRTPSRDLDRAPARRRDASLARQRRERGQPAGTAAACVASRRRAGTTRNCMTWPVVSGIGGARSRHRARRRRTARRARRCASTSSSRGHVA